MFHFLPFSSTITDHHSSSTVPLPSSRWKLKVTSPQHCPVCYCYGLSCPATSIRVTDLVFFPLSQHDTTLVALQMALDVYNKIQPPYASCHLFELYQEDDG